MKRKAIIGLTGDYKDSCGNFIVPGPGLSLLDGIPECSYSFFKEHLPVATAEQLRGIDIVFTTSPVFSNASIDGNDRLISIHRNGSGYDMIDVEALTENNIILLNTQAAVKRPVAVAAMTFILALSTRLVDKIKITKEGRWNEVPDYIGYGLKDKILGIIGAGNIGREIISLSKPFDMMHIVYDPMISADTLPGIDIVELDVLLKAADFICVTCPLNSHTRNLIGRREFGLMKNSSYIINVARGPIIDEKALITALEETQIRGAGIDVFEVEPTPVDNPLLNLDNVITTPHSLGWTDESVIAIWAKMVAQAKQLISGQIPDGVVNPEVLSKDDFWMKYKKFLNPLY